MDIQDYSVVPCVVMSAFSAILMTVTIINIKW